MWASVKEFFSPLWLRFRRSLGWRPQIETCGRMPTFAERELMEAAQRRGRELLAQQEKAFLFPDARRMHGLLGHLGTAGAAAAAPGLGGLFSAPTASPPTAHAPSAAGSGPISIASPMEAMLALRAISAWLLSPNLSGSDLHYFSKEWESFARGTEEALSKERPWTYSMQTTPPPAHGASSTEGSGS